MNTNYVLVALLILLVYFLMRVRNSDNTSKPAPRARPPKPAPDPVHVKRQQDIVEPEADKPHDYLVVAQDFMNQQRYEDAIQELKTGLSKQPSNSALMLKLLNVYAVTNNTNQFNSLYDQLVMKADSGTVDQAKNLKAMLDEEASFQANLSDAQPTSQPTSQPISHLGSHTPVTDSPVSDANVSVSEREHIDHSDLDSSIDFVTDPTLDNSLNEGSQSAVTDTDTEETSLSFEDLESQFLRDDLSSSDVSSTVDSPTDELRPTLDAATFDEPIDEPIDDKTADFSFHETTLEPQFEIQSDELSPTDEPFSNDLEFSLDKDTNSDAPVATETQERTSDADDFDLHSDPFFHENDTAHKADSVDSIDEYANIDFANIHSDTSDVDDSKIEDSTASHRITDDSSANDILSDDSTANDRVIEETTSDTTFDDFEGLEGFEEFEFDNDAADSDQVIDSLDSVPTAPSSKSADSLVEDSLEEHALDEDSIVEDSLVEDTLVENNLVEDSHIEDDLVDDANEIERPVSIPSFEEWSSQHDESTALEESTHSATEVEQPTDLEAPIVDDTEVSDFSPVETEADAAEFAAEDAEFQDVFDFVEDLDGSQITLDLAQQYLELGEYDSAKRLINEVLESDASIAQKTLAKDILTRMN